MNKSISMLLGILFAFSAVPVFSSDMLSALDETQRKDLEAGKQVVISKDIEGGVWPELTVFTRVKAPVDTVAKVFLDYDNAQNYVPNLISAKVIGEPEKDVRDVEYTSRMPLLGNSSYTVRNWYDIQPGSAVVRWKLLQSPMAEISDGSLRVEPAAGGSVLRYTNYVKPKSAIAVVAKGAALSEVKKTVEALKNEAERRATAP